MERRPRAGKEWRAATKHDGAEIKLILIDQTGFGQALRQGWSANLNLACQLGLQAPDHLLEVIRDNMERDRDNFLRHLNEGSKIYRAIGDCAPAFGMIGTLLGMVQMFSNMSDPSKLGPFMAVALLATLYGALVANLICLPIADKLHGKLLDEETNRTLIIDGILMIRDSKSPALVREMLLAYLPEKHRHEEGELAAA